MVSVEEYRDLLGGAPVKKVQHETKLQINLVYMLRLDFHEDDLIIAAIPNGANVSAAERGKLLAMGMLPGMSDLLFFYAKVIAGTTVMLPLLCELKTPEGGTLSDEQREIRRRVQAMGGEYFVARDYETIRDKLVSVGVRCLNKIQLKPRPQ